MFNGASVQKNIVHIDLNDRSINNARFFQVNQLPQIDSHLTAKLYVDKAINEESSVRDIQDTDFNIYNLPNKNSITLNTQAVKDDQVITRAYVDQFHQENEQSRQDLGIDFSVESNDLLKNNQDNEFDFNKLTNLYSILVNRNPSSDNELANKKYVDESNNLEIKFIKNLTLEKLHRQRILKEEVAITLFGAELE